MTLLLILITLVQSQLTPGALARDAKGRVLSKDYICAKKWGTDRRHVTPYMKVVVATSYGVERKQVVARGKGPCCEFDHLIPRELGGADDVKNLWPQPWADAQKKDKLENYLHRQVCAGKMDLADAQAAIAKDWIAAYGKMR